MTDRLHNLMNRCFSLAGEASRNHENPVGAIITDREGNIIAEASESNKSRNDITCHAEIEVIRKALHTLNVSILSDTILYSTHEPCLMCSYVIRHYNIAKVVFANAVREVGGSTSQFPILKTEAISHWNDPPEIVHYQLPE